MRVELNERTIEIDATTRDETRLLMYYVSNDICLRLERQEKKKIIDLHFQNEYFDIND